MRVRFAPSPTGKLHLGNIRTAVVNWLHVRSQGGSFLLRLDDTDTERSTQAYAEGIEADLRWLGLTWDEFARQSDRNDRYELARDKLIADGRLYPCYETADELALKRKSLLQRGKPPIYDRAALSLTAEQKAAYEAEGRLPHWRFKLVDGDIDWQDLVRGPSHFEAQYLSDPVLIREDGRYLYTLSSVVDDIELGVTDIIRGEDHVANTAVQVQLFEALGGAVPTFGHLPLITDAEGQGLSKRLGSASVEAFKEDGIEPLAIVAYLAALGTPDAPKVVTEVSQLAADYDIGRYGRATPKASMEEVLQLNTRIIHALPFAVIADKLPGWSEALWTALKDNVEQYEAAADVLAMVQGDIQPVIDEPEFIAEAAALLPGSWDGETWHSWTEAVKQATGRKGKQLFMPLRLAITGQAKGPEMATLLPLIDRARVLTRLAG
jgi:glutamyl-tRNA synthetase